MRLQCSMLYAQDFPRMKEFYMKLLGAEPLNTQWTDSWALFETGFALHAIPTGHVSNAGPASVRENLPMKLIFTVDDVPAERERLEGMGVSMLPRSWQQPSESCDGVDPEGNVFQIVAADRWPQVSGTSL